MRPQNGTQLQISVLRVKVADLKNESQKLFGNQLITNLVHRRERRRPRRAATQAAPKEKLGLAAVADLGNRELRNMEVIARADDG
jgi:hypothetical protein